MRRLIYPLIIAAFISCKGKENNQQTGQTDSLKTTAAPTEYTCPMHADVNSDKPGKCPHCGMDLQAKS